MRLAVFAIFIISIITILFLIDWIITIIDILGSEFENPTNKVVWLIIGLGLPILGSTLYHFIGKEQKRTSYFRFMEHKKPKRIRKEFRIKTEPKL